jgi:transposase
LYQERKEEIRKSFIENLEKVSFEPRIYLGESGINKYLYRQHARSLRGKKVEGEISGKQFARQSVISALYQGKFLSPMCFEGTCNASLFNVWLKQMLIPVLNPGQVLILDNATFHKSVESKKLIEATGCKLLFLLAYSPDLNPIEKYWANMKTKVRELLPKVQNFTKALDTVILSM